LGLETEGKSRCSGGKSHIPVRLIALNTAW
jgi:hypothetical protein